MSKYHLSKILAARTHMAPSEIKRGKKGKKKKDSVIPEENILLNLKFSFLKEEIEQLRDL